MSNKNSENYTTATDHKLIDEQFRKIQVRIFRQFKKNPDVEALLFLIGMRELGVVKENFSKEEKVNLMHIATCKLMSYNGYFELEGLDKDGWPHWVAIKPVPQLPVEEQEYLLKQLIIRYFAEL
jgi:hypothetical protein